jgi:phosphatidylserine decarboxylase
MDWSDEPYIVKEGHPYIAAAAFFTLFAAASGLCLLSWLLLLATLAVAAFFRNPYRVLSADEKAILCPADGRVLEVVRQGSEGLLGIPAVKISIFMSPLNVHVNRIPASGTLVRRTHRPGRFYVASQPKASVDNERMEVLVAADAGVPVGVVQIAGRLARRIVCYPKEGDRVTRGQRFGMIRFGSRVELFLPEGVRIAVKEGDRVRGGETVMGYFP